MPVIEVYPGAGDCKQVQRQGVHPASYDEEGIEDVVPHVQADENRRSCQHWTQQGEDDRHKDAHWSSSIDSGRLLEGLGYRADESSDEENHRRQVHPDIGADHSDGAASQSQLTQQ